jgi:hypothetical protein
LLVFLLGQEDRHFERRFGDRTFVPVLQTFGNMFASLSPALGGPGYFLPGRRPSDHLRWQVIYVGESL